MIKIQKYDKIEILKRSEIALLEDLDKKELIQIIQKLEKENNELKEKLYGKIEEKEVEKEALTLLKRVGLGEKTKAYPRELSGGQKQRVASARAMITNPTLVLADEPTGALDSKSARMLLENFEYLNESFQATILMVTHDAFTASYASRVIFIKDGKIFHELKRGEDSRKEFFDKIIDVVTLLGGDLNDVI